MIVGIDPGTTAAFAVLDLSGNAVAFGSQKQFDADSFISKLVSFGKTLAIGTDKVKIPSFVQTIATRIGARVIAPSYDLLSEYKRELAASVSLAGGHTVRNMHELDSLAAAVFAFRRLEPLMHKIRKYLEREGKLSLFEQVAALVIKERISIKAALLTLAPLPKQNVEVSLPLRQDDELARVCSLLFRTQKDARALLLRNCELEKQLLSLENTVTSLRSRMNTLVKPKRLDDELYFKQKQIHATLQKLAQEQAHSQKQSATLARLEKFILNPLFVPIPRFPRLSASALPFKIVHAPVVFIDDARQVSATACFALAELGTTLIISPLLPSARTQENLPFAFACVEQSELFSSIAYVCADWLLRVRSEKKVIAKVIQDYQLSRRTHAQEHQD